MTDQQKTFSMRTPADFLAKLRWERQRLATIAISDNPAFQYQVMNCAADAWHMAEWVYLHLPEEEKAKFKGMRDFKDYVRKESRYIRVCREIADAAKHWHLDNAPDPAVRTPEFFYGEAGQNLWYIADGLRADDPRQIIDGAIAYWERYIEPGHF